MSNLLFPILRRGAADGAAAQADLLVYATRDYRGVEAGGDADRTGFNEEADWSARCEEALTREHRADGCGHRGPKHAFADIRIYIKRTDPVSGVSTPGISSLSVLDGEAYESASPFITSVAIDPADMPDRPTITISLVFDRAIPACVVDSVSSVSYWYSWDALRTKLTITVHDHTPRFPFPFSFRLLQE